jgi:uncharacterized protein (DUF1499 family)
MAFGFPASYSERLPLPTGESDDDRELLMRLVDLLGWSIVDVSHAAVTATTKPSMIWGVERVTLELAPNETVQAVSRCAFPLQILDWGKNKANIERLRKQMARLPPRRK